MKKALVLLLTFAMLLSLVACSSGEEATAPADPSVEAAPEAAVESEGSDTLVVGLTGEPSGLDMCQFQDGVSAMVYCQLYDTLVYFNYETMELEPCLAKSWEQIDDKTIRFTLRDDVYFHNGEQLKASDVIYTLQRGKVLPAKQFIWGPFDEVNSKVVDDFTVDICSYEPFAPMLTYLSDNGAYIVSEKGVEDQGLEAFNRNPVGTGAFKFNEWVPGEYVMLERNDQYWNGTPYYKYMTFVFMADSTARTLALQTGDIDVCPDPIMTSLADLENAGFNVATCNDMISTNIVFNTQHPILSNKLVRKAMQYALDIPAIGDVAFSGTGRVADSFFPYYIPGRTDATGDLVYTYDVEKAKALMAEAGYPDGFTIKVWTNENQNRIAICEMIQNAWAQIGITAEVTVMEHAAMIALYSNGEHEIVVNGFSAGAPDGDFVHDNFYSTVEWGTNYTGYRNPEWDKLMDDARTLTGDPAGREALYAQAIDILREDLPTISVRYSEVQIAYRGDLTGVTAHPNKIPRYWWVEPAA